ncbi:Rubredoxin-type fold [Artemisia annua]|uniref:Rubredoxin-type fold n=1 Tax=Artemisia annua TaxID=35608 RepID=A0A2U1KL05_ARTAN|nr:Rubredoxin-type fold [Artemisia annua]
MHHDCPYLFDSVDDVTAMPCGHTIHKKCLKDMQQHSQVQEPAGYDVTQMVGGIGVCEQPIHPEPVDSKSEARSNVGYIAFASHPKLMEFGAGVVRHVHRHNFPVGLQVLDTDISGSGCSSAYSTSNRHV